MKTQRMGLTVINLVLMILLLAQFPRAEAQEVAPVLHSRALEIVDAQGRVRAEIVVYPAETVNSKAYPETVLFRMADANRGPVVKLAASENGSALGLSDDATGRVELHANGDTGNCVRVVDKNGREQVIKPQ